MKTLLEVLNQQSRPVITVNCVIFGFDGKDILKSASNLNGNLNCSKELEHYAS